VSRGVLEVFRERLDPGESAKVIGHLPLPLRSCGPRYGVRSNTAAHDRSALRTAATAVGLRPAGRAPRRPVHDAASCPIRRPDHAELRRERCRGGVTRPRKA
jgi:hypothetical protein